MAYHKQTEINARWASKKKCDSYLFCYRRFKCGSYQTVWFLASSSIAIFISKEKQAFTQFVENWLLITKGNGQNV